MEAGELEFAGGHEAHTRNQAKKGLIGTINRRSPFRAYFHAESSESKQ